MNNQSQKPIYTEKVNEVLTGLKEGKSREELAKHFDHSNWKSLDIYMRRKHFTWDTHNQTYIPKTDEQKQDPIKVSSKAARIIKMLQDGVDVQEAANKLGYRDHRDLAQYMTSKGFKWDIETNNYVSEVDKHTQITEDSVSEDSLNQLTESAIESDISTPLKGGEEIQKYLPLLRVLEAKQEILLELLDDNPKSIPRYMIPGVKKSKSYYTTDMMEQLVKEYSKEKNIKQREVIEVALIEFFRKYGFKQELKRLFEN